jgi:hypothetical protein
MTSYTSGDRTLSGTVSQRTSGIVQLAPSAGRTLRLSGLLDRLTTTAGAPGAISVSSGTVVFDGTVSSVTDTDWTVAGGTLQLANGLSDQNDAIVSVAADAAVRSLFVNKTEAFAQVAKETGRSAATVTTTYYRIAKRQPGGGGVRRSAKTAKAATRKAVSGQTDRLAADARSAIDALHQHVASLEAQLEELAQKSQELERIKKALGRI